MENKINRRKFMKKGILTSAGLLIASGCDESPKRIAKSSFKNDFIKGNIEKNRNNYRKIDWILNDKKGIYGTQSGNAVKKLEELVFTEKTPEKELTEWEITTMSKFVPIKKLIEKNAHHYCINPMWATMFFTYESSLMPIDHNKISDDYGLGQIKLKDERLAKKLGTNPLGQFYSPDLKAEKSIFDPETNIIMAMLLNRYNIERHELDNSDQAYTVYVNGLAGLNEDGSISEKSLGEHINPFHDRYNYYQNIIPFFREVKEIKKVTNKDTKNLLDIYNNSQGPKEIYEKELNYFLNNLEKNVKGDTRSVLIYEDCSTFSRTLDLVWKENQINNYDRLLNIGNKIPELIDENPNYNKKVKDELKGMVGKTRGLLLTAKDVGYKG